ncbi:hypothetical protein M5689_022563 [Euphorbia peplus]|nr:hypothetical protein M5689_022563 [Euphorbia peplus]
MVNPYQFRHGFSKSQSCLHKILQIIASYPSQELKSSSIPQNIEFEEKKDQGIDLNTQLFSWPEDRDESDNFSAGSTTAAAYGGAGGGDFEKSSSEGECDPIQNAIQTKGSEKSEELNEGVSHGGFTAAVTAEVAEVEGGERRPNCFSILIEAAEMANEESGGDDGGDEVAVTAEVAVAVEEVVVRSKRGRSHVLPSRYRDSVIEPVKRRQLKRGKFNK